MFRFLSGDSRQRDTADDGQYDGQHDRFRGVGREWTSEAFGRDREAIDVGRVETVVRSDVKVLDSRKYQRRYEPARLCQQKPDRPSNVINRFTCQRGLVHLHPEIVVRLTHIPMLHGHDHNFRQSTSPRV